VRHDGIIEGDVEVARFTSDVDTSDLEDGRTVYCAQNPADCTGDVTFMGIQQNLGGQFQRVYWHDARAYTQTVASSGLRVYLWFPHGTNTMVLMVLRTQFTQAASDALFHALLDLERGAAAAPVPVPTPQVVIATPGPSPTSDIGGPGGLPPTSTPTAAP